MCFMNLYIFTSSLSAALPVVTAFNKNCLLVEFSCQRNNNDATSTVINMKATNSSPFPMNDFVFQAAVPKVNKECTIELL